MFGVSTATAQRLVWRVARAIVTHLTPEHICWPSPAELAAHAAAVQLQYSIPHAAGFVDGTHVRIAPKDELQRVYCFNRKGWHSVILQAVVDRSGRFINVHIGWAGRVHDARVFANSDLVRQIMSTPAPIELLPEPLVIIADAAYPLTSWCVTPYAVASTVEERLFNARHSSARMAVERAFGKLKAQWGLLVKNVSYGASAMPLLVLAACTLHNITINVDDGLGWEPTADAVAAVAALDAGTEEPPAAGVLGVPGGDLRHSLAQGKVKRTSMSEQTLATVVAQAGVVV